MLQNLLSHCAPDNPSTVAPTQMSVAPTIHRCLVMVTPTSAPPLLQKFLSHCAPDDPSTMAPQQMSVALLRKALKARGTTATGSKAALAAELTAALAAEAVQAAAADSTPGTDENVFTRQQPSTLHLKPSLQGVTQVLLLNGDPMAYILQTLGDQEFSASRISFLQPRPSQSQPGAGRRPAARRRLAQRLQRPWSGQQPPLRRSR